MALVKIKQIDGLQTELDLKATQSQLISTETSIETQISTEAVAREDGDTYLEVTSNPQTTNSITFGAGENWKGGNFDINVYVNGVKIDSDAYTHTPGSNGAGDTITFNLNLVGYNVETTDEVTVIGNIA